jgi:hypothetical protein
MRVWIAALLAVCVMTWAGSAWAAHVELFHAVRVQMRDGVADFSTEPKFRELFVRVGHPELPNQPMGHYTGDFAFKFNDEVKVGESKSPLTGAHTFKLWSEGNTFYPYSSPGDDAGNEIWFGEGGETALSESTFSYRLLDSEEKEVLVKSNEKFPVIRPASKQFTDKCVPYIELDFDDGGTIVKGVRWRFVDPDNTAKPLLVSDAPIKFVSGVGIDRLGAYIEHSLTGSEPGSEWAGYITINPVSIDNLNRVRLFFVYKDGEKSESVVIEQWRFIVNDNDDISGEFVTEADLDAVKVATKKLTNPPGGIIAVDENSGQIFTGTKVLANSNAEIDKARTSSIISVKQQLKNPGDAVAFTNKLGFALKAKSLEDIELPQPEDFSALKAGYSVLKHFEGGGAIDLLAEFGDEIFSYNYGEERVTLNATIVIIDGPAPGDEPKLLKSYANGNYGVKLVTEGETKYLYIWDGVKDQIASDPLALAAKDNASSSSGGGCDAGFGLLGLLPLAVWVARKRMTA